jgi:NAD(P)-dependent dehydrogenase (short-subunit alcohol dehydrogenase family)
MTIVVVVGLPTLALQPTYKPTLQMTERRIGRLSGNKSERTPQKKLPNVRLQQFGIKVMNNRDDNNQIDSNSRLNLLEQVLESTKETATNVFATLGALTTVATFPLIATVTVAADLARSVQANDDLRYYTPSVNTLTDQVIVVTGGTSGLGLETSKRLAYGGATVVLTSRSRTKGELALQSIQSYLQSKNVINQQVYWIPCNLDDFTSIRQFPTLFQSLLGQETQINVLLNNAGVMAIPQRELTVDGYERTFQSNHLGPFLLTNVCMSLMATNARIINVSSSAHRIPGDSGLDVNNLNSEKQYGPWVSYGQSKLAAILFTNELQKRANASNRLITVVSLHPGVVQTDLWRYLIGIEASEQIKQAVSNNPLLSQNVQWLSNLFSNVILSVEEGASTQIYLSSLAEDSIMIQPGGYYEKCRVVPTASYAMDERKAKILWELSEQMTGQPFLLQ